MTEIVIGLIMPKTILFALFEYKFRLLQMNAHDKDKRREKKSVKSATPGSIFGSPLT
jgi:hypothetical protein